MVQMSFFWGVLVCFWILWVVCVCVVCVLATIYCLLFIYGGLVVCLVYCFVVFGLVCTFVLVFVRFSCFCFLTPVEGTFVVVLFAWGAAVFGVFFYCV